ncbi:hypothetical protein [Kitasatospora sp. NPDC004531]
MPAQRQHRARPIYVELSIRTDLGKLWELTQQPWHHQRWDARFSRIDYLALPSRRPATGSAAEPPAPIGFRYRLGLGRRPALTGTGTTTAERWRADGQRVSALRFAADSGWSPLQEGAGYWRYLPSRPEDADRVTFITGYDYRTWSWPGGAQLDRHVVRPLVGWLTAWSFDRLRLWAEHGISPERALWHGLAEVAVRAGAAALAGVVDAAVTGRPVAGVLTAGVVLGASVLVPPSRLTPAARRCRRRPRPDARGRAAARPPRLLCTLAAPTGPSAVAGPSTVADQSTAVHQRTVPATNPQRALEHQR